MFVNCNAQLHVSIAVCSCQGACLPASAKTQTGSPLAALQTTLLLLAPTAAISANGILSNISPTAAYGTSAHSQRDELIVLFAGWSARKPAINLRKSSPQRLPHGCLELGFIGSHSTSWYALTEWKSSGQDWRVGVPRIRKILVSLARVSDRLRPVTGTELSIEKG